MSLMTELRYSGTVTPNRIKRKARRKIEARSDQKSDVHDACAEVIQAAAKRLSCVLGMLSSLEVKVLRPT